MLIKSIILENSPIYGDITFDFCDTNGLPFNTVLLAGENGTGKSTLLNVIYDFFSTIFPTKQSQEKRTFVLELNNDEVNTLCSSERFKQRMLGYALKNELIVTLDCSVINSWDNVKASISREEGPPLNFEGFILGENDVKTIFKNVFSDVEVNYTTGNITSTSSLDVDILSQSSIKSSSNLATEIAQLLIDIEALDSSDFAEWARENQGKQVSEGITDKRMSRFKNAFNYMFPTKRFNKVVNTAQGKKVMFEEHGKEISLSDLSSGEKQIVFRGSFLLKDKFSTQGAVVLIDEPEISLHPRWQLKILDFYKTLFLNDENVQTSQIFVATHSPFVIHNDNRDKDKIVVLGKNENGVFVQSEPKFFNWTSEAAITQAFDIQLNYEKDKLVVLVEGPTDELYIKKALEVFGKNHLPVIVQWVGREDAAGHKFTGDSALTHSKEYLLSNNNVSNNKFLLLYDSDTKVSDKDFETANLYIRKSPKNDENERFKIGVENLLTLPSDFPSEDFYTIDEKTDEYGGSIFSKKLNKVKLCNWICNELSEDEQKVYLSKIETELIKIIEEVNNKEFHLV